MLDKCKGSFTSFLRANTEPNVAGDGGRAGVKNRVRELRTAKGWSQGELAERLGVSRQTVNAIETERYDPSLPLAFVIADLFGKRIEDLFEPGKTE
jgi:putative transcriptional regulator